MDQRSRVTRLIAGYSMWLKLLILLGLSLQFAISAAYADGSPALRVIPPQTIVADQPFSYRIVVDSEQPLQVGMRLINAPKGATLTDNGDGSYQFRWTPPAEVGDKTVIIVQAFNFADPNVISTQRVVLQRGNAEQISAESKAASKAATMAASKLVSKAATKESNVKSASVVVASNNAIGSRFLTPPNTPTTSDNTNALNRATPTAVQPRKVEKSATAFVPDSTIEPSVTHSTITKSTASESPAGAESSENQSAAQKNSVEPNTVAAAGDPLAVETETIGTESIASHRPELPEIGTQRLVVGKEFQFFIRPITPEGVDVTVQLSAESLPKGATFEDVFEGNKMLRWKPTADQVGGHQMVLVLVAVDETQLALRTEREVILVVEPEPPVELAPEITIEPISAQIVSAGRKVNIRVAPITSDNKTAQVHVDRLPAGGSFDENKDGTRTFHWPTTQADQGEHTFRFTAIHPENAELVANANVLIVVGSPDGPGSGSSVVTISSASPSPELDTYPSADSPSPASYGNAPSPEPYPSADSPSPSPEQPYPSADQPSPEPLAVRPPPQPRPSPD